MSATIWFSSLWVTNARSVSDLLFVYFLYLMNGVLPMLLFGFVLRRAAKGMGLTRTWQWLVAGAILTPGLTALLGMMSSWHIFQGTGWRDWISTYLLSTSSVYAPPNPNWIFLITAPAGAATAWVLFRIDRAFAAPTSDTPE
ncbi:MAG: hypothetical protein WA876_16465 [Candidatus Acidiferrales bacterium]